MSDKPIFISGFWFRDGDGKKFTEPKYFFPNSFSQFSKKNECKWLFNNKDEKPLWVNKINYLREDKLKLNPLDFYEFNQNIGWDFNSQYARREIFLVSFENENKFYEIKSPSYSLIHNETNNSGKLILVADFCKNIE